MAADRWYWLGLPAVYKRLAFPIRRSAAPLAIRSWANGIWLIRNRPGQHSGNIGELFVIGSISRPPRRIGRHNHCYRRSGRKPGVYEYPSNWDNGFLFDGRSIHDGRRPVVPQRSCSLLLVVARAHPRTTNETGRASRSWHALARVLCRKSTFPRAEARRTSAIVLRTAFIGGKYPFYRREIPVGVCGQRLYIS